MSQQLTKTVTVLWLGSNNVLVPAFEFDFDQRAAQQALQQLVAKSMQCTVLGARVLYNGRDVAFCPDTLETYERDRWNYNFNEAKAKKAWALLQSELCLLSKVTLHASRFDKVNVWIHEVLNKPYQHSYTGNTYPLKTIPKTFPPEAWHSPAFVLAACRANVQFFANASKELRSDRTFVLTVCKRHCDALHYASRAFLSDKEFLLELCTANASAFRVLPAWAQADSDIMQVC